MTSVWWEPRVISCSNSGVHLRLPCDWLFINTCLSFPICDLDQEGKAAIPTYLTGLLWGSKRYPSEGQWSLVFSVQALGRTGSKLRICQGALLPGARAAL